MAATEEKEKGSIAQDGGKQFIKEERRNETPEITKNSRTDWNSRRSQNPERRDTQLGDQN